LGFDSVTGFHGICGFALLGKAFEKDNFNHLDFEVSCAKEKSLPSSYGGVSGGGVWQLELKLKDGKLAPKIPFFLVSLSTNLICRTTKGLLGATVVKVFIKSHTIRYLPTAPNFAVQHSAG
jgi:hypothetical protein